MALRAVGVVDAWGGGPCRWQRRCGHWVGEEVEGGASLIIPLWMKEDWRVVEMQVKHFATFLTFNYSPQSFNIRDFVILFALVQLRKH